MTSIFTKVIMLSFSWHKLNYVFITEVILDYILLSFLICPLLQDKSTILETPLYIMQNLTTNYDLGDKTPLQQCQQKLNIIL